MHIFVDRQRIALIPGSCVGMSPFVGRSPAHKARIFLLPASMLKDKGVVEFTAAARPLKAVASHWRFVLAGAVRYDNPSAIGLAQLLARKQAVEGRKRTESAANSAADSSCEQSRFCSHFSGCCADGL